MATVVLGVSGSIAAYKAADLASQLVKAGHDVHPVLTASAAKMIDPMTFRALTGNPSPVSAFESCYPGEIPHIHLARIADIIAIVPASMNLMARLANGMGDDMLSVTVAATTAPILLAPGMNTVMWDHLATQRNIEQLRKDGYYFVDPVVGRLACRTEGTGKMAEVPTIYDAIAELLDKKQVMAGKRVLVTAGPTREPIDPVRYISNRSSGKMGFAIAEEARILGAEVTVIAGPSTATVPGGVRLIRVETSREMYDATIKEYDNADFVVAAAAVADYRPSQPSASKIKKEEAQLSVTLDRTQDILAELGRRKSSQVLIGFAAETDELQKNALKKLESKHLDWIVANDVTQAGAGFDVDTNIVDIYSSAGDVLQLPQLSKDDVARKLWAAVLRRDLT